MAHPSLPSIRDIFPGLSRTLLPSPPPSSSSSESAKPPKQPGYSFNVLRADPITASLEHVASSTTIRPRSGTVPGMHGTAPVFRVAVPGDHRPSRQRQHRPVREILPDTREREPPSIPREADHHRSPTSTILSFPVADAPVITSDGRRVHLRSDPQQPEGRGKKHQCPHCGKRFNRPSSMKIHVNTHTGAKPYRCPFPGCGREFNVNSNMRRHWRNHSRSAPMRLPDQDVCGVYHHHHRALMSPPATNSSVSEGNSDEDVYSDEDAMEVEEEADLGKPSRASSDVSVWSRSASPARAPAVTAYPPLHRHAPQDQQGRHAHAHDRGGEYIYRPSIAAYAISCTDQRVSTALRPAFTSSCTRERYRREKR